MEDVEISRDEGEDRKVVLHKILRFLHRQPRVDDLQRHLVAARANCSGGQRRWDDASYILVLKAFFLFCLGLSLPVTFFELYINSLSSIPSVKESSEQNWGDRAFYLTWTKVVFLGVFTATFVIIVLVRMKSRPSSQETRMDIQNL